MLPESRMATVRRRKGGTEERRRRKRRRVADRETYRNGYGWIYASTGKQIICRDRL